ncbi:MAG: hypothetical protein ACRDRL_00190 [Sciscionella sp.]
MLTTLADPFIAGVTFAATIGALSMAASAYPEIAAGKPMMLDAVGLPREAVLMRVRRYGLSSQWERRHARLMVPVRLGIGVWLTLLTVIMYRAGRGRGWGLLLMPAAALHFYLAYRLSHATQD